MCNPRQLEVPSKYNFLYFGALQCQSSMISVSREPPVVQSRLTPQNEHKNGFTTDFLRYVYSSDNRNCPRNVFLCFFGALYYKISKVSISQELQVFLFKPTLLYPKPGWNEQKFEQKLINTLRLSFYCFYFIQVTIQK